MNTESFTRIKLLKVWEVLLNYSSAEKPLSTTEMLKRLKRAGVPCDRRTLYGDIDVLIGCGYDVKVVRSRENFYYTNEQSFSKEDLFVISESVRRNGNISVSKTNGIIKNLCDLSFDKSRKNAPTKVLAPYMKKSVTNEVYDKVETLLNAISDGKQLEITARSYNTEGGKAVKKEGKPFTVSPLSVVFYCGAYYFSYYNGKDVDKIEAGDIGSIKVLPAALVKPNIMANSLNKKIVDGICGRAEKVTFIADNRLIGEVFKYFGELINAVKQGADKFSFTEEVAVNDALFSWCIAKGGLIKINAPLKVKKEYEAFVKKTYDSLFE